MCACFRLENEIYPKFATELLLPDNAAGISCPCPPTQKVMPQLARLENLWYVRESLDTVNLSHIPRHGQRQNSGPSSTAALPAHPRRPFPFAWARNRSACVAPRDVTRGVTLMAILKKIKGNVTSVWSGMPVLQGLNHPNIVPRFVCPSSSSLSATPFLILRARVVVFLSPNCIWFSVGQIFRVVRVADRILPRIWAHCRRQAVLSISANVATHGSSERDAVLVLGTFDRSSPADSNAR